MKNQTNRSLKNGKKLLSSKVNREEKIKINNPNKLWYYDAKLKTTIGIEDNKENRRLLDEEDNKKEEKNKEKREIAKQKVKEIEELLPKYERILKEWRRDMDDIKDREEEFSIRYKSLKEDFEDIVDTEEYEDIYTGFNSFSKTVDRVMIKLSNYEDGYKKHRENCKIARDNKRKEENKLINPEMEIKKLSNKMASLKSLLCVIDKE